MGCTLHIDKNMDIFDKNGWLTVGWSYLVHKNIGIKYMIEPPEEVENNIVYATSIVVKIYKIKMDIYFNNVDIYMKAHLIYHADMYRF